MGNRTRKRIRDWVSMFSRFRRLPQPERRLLVQAGCLIAILALSLKVFRFQRVRAALARLTPGELQAARDASEPLAEVLQVVCAVDRAARHAPFQTSCLHRSLALWGLLRRRGFASALQLGVRKRNAGFEAHAWVERGGVVLGDGAATDPEYVRVSWVPVELDR